jgi:hypothetical protein
VYGSRPRGTQFASIEQFNEDFDFLAKCLDRMIDEEKDRKATNWNKFIGRLTEIRNLVQGCSWVESVDILADAEDELESMKFYGYERLEWHFDIQYGSIKQFLEEVA